MDKVNKRVYRKNGRFNWKYLIQTNLWNTLSYKDLLNTIFKHIETKGFTIIIVLVMCFGKSKIYNLIVKTKYLK